MGVNIITSTLRELAASMTSLSPPTFTCLMNACRANQKKEVDGDKKKQMITMFLNEISEDIIVIYSDLCQLIHH